MTETTSPARPELLVSVQNEVEARLALSLGVRWIDLKAPALGSLGCPDVATARQVAEVLAVAARLGDDPPAPACQTSVALGELRTLNTAPATELLQLFPIAKIGLAGMAHATHAAGANNTAGANNAEGSADERPLDPAIWQGLEKLFAWQRCDGQLVLASYADHRRAAAPSPEQVIELAKHFGGRYVLIDTFLKDGLGLFHWLSPRRIASLREQAASIGAELVVAGSLRSADWPLLCEAAPAIIGVRGSVCTGDRASRLSPERINEWLAWTAG